MSSVDSTNTGVAELLCPECGYDLRQLASDRCPECGSSIDRTILGESIVPWIHREKLGRYRAFWKTVHMATFRTRFFAREMSRPARFEDAVKFRRLVVLHALLPIGIGLTIWYVAGLSQLTFAKPGLWVSTDVVGSLFQIVAIPVGWLCLAMFFFGMTGAASYFFHPRYSVVQQNRAIALSYYTCAPLAYTPLSVILILAMVGIAFLAHGNRMPILVVGLMMLITIGPVAVQLGAMVMVPVGLLGASTHCSLVRRAALMIFLPLSWWTIALVTLVFLPGLYGLIALIVLSFRP